MATCVDCPPIGRIGCGAEYSGLQQHSSAKVPWSEYSDGMAHLTFAGERAASWCWKGKGMVHPSTLRNKVTKEPLLELGSRGWRVSTGYQDGPNSDVRVAA